MARISNNSTHTPFASGPIESQSNLSPATSLLPEGGCGLARRCIETYYDREAYRHLGAVTREACIPKRARTATNTVRSSNEIFVCPNFMRIQWNSPESEQTIPIRVNLDTFRLCRFSRQNQRRMHERLLLSSIRSGAHSSDSRPEGADPGESCGILCRVQGGKGAKALSHREAHRRLGRS